MKLWWLALLLVPLASAGDDCQVYLGGERVGDDPVSVSEDDVLDYRLEAPAAIARWHIGLQAGPLRQTLAEHEAPTSSTAVGRIDLANASTYGVGIYRVETTIWMQDGQRCTVNTWVLVEGNAFATLAGLVAAGVLLGGIGGLVAAILMGWLDLKEVRDAIKDYKEQHQRKRRWDS